MNREAMVTKSTGKVSGRTAAKSL